MNHKSKESLFDPILHTNTKYERRPPSIVIRPSLCSDDLHIRVIPNKLVLNIITSATAYRFSILVSGVFENMRIKERAGVPATNLLHVGNIEKLSPVGVSILVPDVG